MWSPWENEFVGIEHVCYHDNGNQQPPEEVKWTQISTKPRRKFLSYDEMKFILYTYNKVKSEGEKNPLEKTVDVTGTPKTTVWRIVTSGPKKRKVRCDKGTFKKFTPADEDLVRRHIYGLYKNNVVPTMSTLYKKLKEDGIIRCGKNTLYQFVKSIGFAFKNVEKNECLMETEIIRKWRYEYLENIQQYRQENRPIIYLDETWYDTHDIIKKGWSDQSGKCKINIPISKGIMTLNAGGENGFVQGALYLGCKNLKDASADYYLDTNAEVFEKWFEGMLLPRLEPNSIIVMDNASYNSVQLNKVPNAESNAKTIKEFLIKEDMYFEDSYTKKELLEVLGTKTFTKKYKIDTLASEYGHTILRLPPSHCIFNPFEIIWGQLKERIRCRNTARKFSDKMLVHIKQEVANTSVESWKNSVCHVVDIENYYRANHVNNLIIEVNEGDFSDSE